MKSVFAVLLVLLQLQPVLGAAACLGLVGPPAGLECQMPERGTAAIQQISQPAPLSPQGCAMAPACASTPPAVPEFLGNLESSIVLQTTTAIGGDAILSEVATAPPFHPPKV